MKGLLLKDYYLIKSVLYIILVVFAVVGIGMSFLTSTWVLTVITKAERGYAMIKANILFSSLSRNVSGIVMLPENNAIAALMPTNSIIDR